MMKDYFRKALSIAVCAAAIAGMMTMGSCTSEVEEPEKKTVTLTFKADGGNWSGSTDDLTLTGKEGETLTAPVTPTKSGYTFSVWNPALPTVFPTEDTTYTATWVLEGDYPITYSNMEGATNAASNPAGYNVETATITLAAATKHGYVFGGWYSDSSLTAAVTEIAKGSTGAKTFYAKWTPNVYYLTINAQGGTCAYEKLYEKYNTGWYTDEACTNEITTDTVLTTPTKSGYAFQGIYGTTDGTGDQYITAAGKKTDKVTNTIVSDNSVTLYAVWKDATAPANVTSLTATSGYEKVTLHWTNPDDADFAKAVVTWTPATGTGTAEVTGTAGSAGAYTVTGLTNRTSYTFTVKAQDGAENKSSGIEIGRMPVAGTLGNITISGTEYANTNEITVIASGKTGTVNMADDSAWSGYYSGTDNWLKGVFLKNRNVQLSPFIMGQYEVTQELYTAVMVSNPSYFTTGVASGETQGLRPVEKASWYDALVFCNKLSKLMGLDPCYTIEVDGIATDDTDKWGTVPTSSNAAWNVAVCDITKSGYRLPTEAEWEYAARGGDTSNEAWKYSYAGVNTEFAPSTFTSISEDAKLAGYGWYGNNSSAKTHEVGKKSANRLGLYDMSGNVWEWCWDWFAASATANDSAYTKAGVVVNPFGAASGDYRVRRGGSWGYISCNCAVSGRGHYVAYDRGKYYGFRVCRSTQ